jgi:hypothetical protein
MMNRRARRTPECKGERPSGWVERCLAEWCDRNPEICSTLKEHKPLVFLDYQLMTNAGIEGLMAQAKEAQAKLNRW